MHRDSDYMGKMEFAIDSSISEPLLNALNHQIKNCIVRFSCFPSKTNPMKINPELALVDYFDLVEKIFDGECGNTDAVEHVIIWSEQQVPLVSKQVDWEQLNLVEYSWLESTVKLEKDSIEDLEFQLEALESLGFLKKISRRIFQVKKSLRITARELFDKRIPSSKQKTPKVNLLVSS